MKKVVAVLPLVAIALAAGIAHAEEIACFATERDSDTVIARADGPSATRCTIALGKEVKESSYCNKHKGETVDLLNHSNKTVMGKQVKPVKFVMTCPK